MNSPAKALFILACSFSSLAAKDINISDFEGETYGRWLIAGSAFGKGPTQGAATKKYANSFHGKGLVTSDRAGDALTGHLTSPPFKIEESFINFLIGGGNLPGQLEIQLLVKDQIVRRSTALENNDALKRGTWDIKEFKNQSAQIRIIDQATGEWGHINIDHIYQSDKKAADSVIVSHKLAAQALAKKETKQTKPTVKPTAKIKPVPEENPAPSAKIMPAPERQSAPTAKIIPKPEKKAPAPPAAPKKPAALAEKKTATPDLISGDLSSIPELAGQQLDIEFSPSKQLFTIFELDHAILRYDLGKNSLQCLLKNNKWTSLGIPIKPRDGKISLQLAVEKESVAISAFNGEITGSFDTHPKQAPRTQKITGGKLHKISIKPIVRAPSSSEIVTVNNPVSYTHLTLPTTPYV